jgi:hypothetical protein
MAAPNLELTSHNQGELTEDRRNGHGVWMYLPKNPVPLAEGLPQVGEFGGFTELPQIVHGLATDRTVLVEGPPGSGKSHLVEDVLQSSIVHDVPVFALSMHINGGLGEGPELVKPQLEKFRDATTETGGLVILDNVDYVGYRGGGRNRRRSRATDYAKQVAPFALDLLKDTKLAVMGTAHDAAWREGQWTWIDEAIDKPAHEILEGFNSRMVFEGNMALRSLAYLIRERDAERHIDPASKAISTGEAALVMRKLHGLGRANFFHARHLDPQAFLEDERREIARIDIERDKRRGKQA